MHFLGIDWVGVNAENGRKLLLSIVFIAAVLAISWGLRDPWPVCWLAVPNRPRCRRGSGPARASAWSPP